MASLDETLELVTQRTGSTSGTPQNEAEAAGFRAGIKLDVASIMNQMNAVYHPLFDTLSKESGLDALDFGLSGNIMFTHISANEANAAAFYDAGLGRARTIKETIDVLLSEISNLENTVDQNVDVDAYDDTEVRGLIGTNQLNLKQLRLDTVGDVYGFDNDGLADNTYSLSQAIDAIGAFFTGFPGTGNTYTPTYPTLALAVNLSDVVLDTTIPISTITGLFAGLGVIYSFTGMSGLADGSPTYSAHGAVSTVSDGQNLEEAIQALDAGLAASTGVYSVVGIITSNTGGTYSSDDFVHGSPSLDDTGTAAEDSRFTFDKSKGAFRAGAVTSTEWDDGNRGTFSFAWGANTTASALAAFCGGFDNSAAAIGSIVLGGGGAGTGNTVDSSSTRSVIVGGASSNILGAVHAAMLVGDTNTIDDSDYAVIVGGSNNSIDGFTGTRNTIVNGDTNAIGNGTQIVLHNFIGGGNNHTITNGDNNFIGCGDYALIDDCDRSAIVAGGAGSVPNQNQIDDSNASFIGAGVNNVILGVGSDNSNTIVAGANNEIGDGVDGVLGAGIVAGNSNDILNANLSFIGGGYNNIIDGATTAITACFIGAGGTFTPGEGNEIIDSNLSAIVGGQNNTIQSTGTHNAIVGGQDNDVGDNTGDERRNFIGGGFTNTITDSDESVIVGGDTNSINTTGESNFIGGGELNVIGDGSGTPQHGVVGGGLSNTIDSSDYSVIAGGRSNTINSSTDYNTIGGGQSNAVGDGTGTPQHSTVAGGFTNVIDDSDYAIIGGGDSQTIDTSTHSAIFGGDSNTITGGSLCFIGGGGSAVPGFENTITNAVQSSIVGGSANDINVTSGGHHLIAGGTVNVIGDGGDTGSFNTIISGNTNSIVDGTYNFIGSGQNHEITSGGNFNVILGGGSASAAEGNKITTASVDYAVILGGRDHDVSDDYGVIIGGEDNIINAGGDYSVILGGLANQTFATRAIAMGRTARSRWVNGMVHGHGVGDSGYARVVWGGTTTDATPTEIYLDAAAGTDRFVLENNKAVSFTVRVAVRGTVTTLSADYEFQGQITRNASAATTAMVYVNKVILHEGDPLLDVNLTADTTNGSLMVEVTGVAAVSYRWVAVGNMVITGA